MNKLPFVLTIDKGVPQEGATSLYARYQERLKSMEPGDSFFLGNISGENIQPLLVYAGRIGVQLIAIDVDEDEIYLAPGVRVWRTAQMSGEEAFGQTQEEKPAATKKTRKPKAEKEEATESAGSRYWHHLTSGLTYATAHNIAPPDNPNVVEIDKATHERIKAENASGPTYWLKPGTDVAVEYLPGKHPPEEQGMVQISKAEFDAHREKWLSKLGTPIAKTDGPAPIWIGEGGITWWRRADGSCVVVPAKKLELAKVTPGAVQIHSAAFEQWQAEQDDDL